MTYLMTEGGTEGVPDREEGSSSGGAPSDDARTPPSAPASLNGSADELREEYVRALIAAIREGHAEAHVCDRVERLLGVA